ncbi:MAG: DUF5408 family protein [Helicobacter sp.]|nr:DUF5408 family protein [Helicobacter sp.]
MENNETKQSQTIAKRAIKIALIACMIMLIFASISLWILLNQITATANLTKSQKTLEERVLQLENKQP